MSDFAEAKVRLEAQLAELERRQKRIAVDLSEPLSPDSTEQAVEMEDDAGLEGERAGCSRGRLREAGADVD